MRPRAKRAQPHLLRTTSLARSSAMSRGGRLVISRLLEAVGSAAVVEPESLGLQHSSTTVILSISGYCESFVVPQWVCGLHQQMQSLRASLASTPSISPL